MTDINTNNRTCGLETLLDAITPTCVTGAEPNADITAVTADSRAVVPGALFVAVRGVAVDGHRFIPAALAAGARAIVAEELPEGLPEGVTGIRVADGRDALGRLASRFFGDPSDELTLVGHAALQDGVSARRESRTHLNGREYCRHRRRAVRTYHPGPRDAQQPPASHGRCRMHLCFHGSEQPCLRPAPYRRAHLRRRYFHKPHARPHRLSQNLRCVS